MREMANLFKAISDETRLEILVLLLLGGELCVCDVEATLGITQSKASRHLRYLLNAGLVENRRAGVWMHYLVPKNLDQARVQIVKAVLETVSEDKRAELERKIVSWAAEKENRGMTCGAS